MITEIQTRLWVTETGFAYQTTQTEGELHELGEARKALRDVVVL